MLQPPFCSNGSLEEMADVSDTGHGAHAIEQLGVEADGARVVRIARERQCHPERREALGLETGANGVESLERAEQEPRARERDERERDLAGDERTANALTRAASRAASATFAQRVGEMDAADSQHRDDAADDRDQRRRPRSRTRPSRGQCAPPTAAEWLVGPMLTSRRMATAASAIPAAADTAVSTSDSPRKYSVTRPRPAPERFAHGELALTAVGPNENEVRDVRARDEQHHAGGRGHDPQRLRDAAGHVILERRDERNRPRLIEQHLRGDAGCEIRGQLDDLRQHRHEVTTGGSDGDAFAKPRDAIVVEPAGRRIVRVEAHRHPDLRLGRMGSGTASA